MPIISRNISYPIFSGVTWDKVNDLGYIKFYDDDVFKDRFDFSIEIHVANLGDLVLDIGVDGEILGIESLCASQHFPSWVLDQATILR